MRILFLGHNGYGYPHTRVRCYHFAKILSSMPGIETGVLSFRDDLAPHKSEAAMYENLRDREKMVLNLKAIKRLLSERGTVVYIQKAHFHAAAPYFLHRLGFLPNFLFDYDDYDIPLSNFFARGIWNRLFFGTNQWDTITYNLARRAKGCVCASHGLVNVLAPYNQHIAYVPTGVDNSAFYPSDNQIQKDEITILWNGLVWGEPIVNNIKMLLNAFQAASIESPKAKLLLVSGGADWPKVNEIIKNKFSDLNIELREWIDPKEMPNLLRECDIGLLPAAGDDLWLQCKSPTKLFEYMASGLAVVASEVGEAKFVIEHQESGYLAKNAGDFTQAMVRLIHDQSMRQKMGKKARERVNEHFSLPVLGENLYLFLKEIFPDRL